MRCLDPVARVSALSLLAALAAAVGAAQERIRITLDGDPPVFKVFGSEVLPRLRAPNFESIFQVRVDQPEVQPIAGSYSVDNGVLIFTPRYPLEPGLRYRAEFRAGAERAAGTFTPPKPRPPPTTYVERVYPSAPLLPENQLKFYVHFSGPMSRGEAVRRIHLLEASGAEVKLPFLELDEELWDREYRRLTLLFDPGRVKRGLVPNEEVGPALHEGRQYTLVIDREWLDSAGVPLKEGYRKSFAVGPADRIPLDPKNWLVKAPAAGGADPLLVDFPEPLDAALLLRFIDVVDDTGKVVKGAVEISREESRWGFTPAEPWKAGNYALEILTALEDLAGNKIGRPFEVDTFERVQQTSTPETYTLPFTIRPPVAQASPIRK